MAIGGKKNVKWKSGDAEKVSSGADGEKAKASGKSQAQPVQMADDMPDFPRGGGSKLSRRERDEVRAEVDAEFDSEGRDFRGKKRKKVVGGNVGRKSAAEDELGSLFGDGLTGKLPRFANKITLKGIIAEVNDKDLAINLTGGLPGLVPGDEAVDAAVLDNKNGKSDFFSSIFHVGQLVSCVVSRVEDDKESGKKKFWVSLRLSLLHEGLTFDAVQEGMLLTNIATRGHGVGGGEDIAIVQADSERQWDVGIGEGVSKKL